MTQDEQDAINRFKEEIRGDFNKGVVAGASVAMAWILSAARFADIEDFANRRFDLKAYECSVINYLATEHEDIASILDDATGSDTDLRHRYSFSRGFNCGFFEKLQNYWTNGAPQNRSFESFSESYTHELIDELVSARRIDADLLLQPYFRHAGMTAREHYCATLGNGLSGQIVAARVIPTRQRRGPGEPSRIQSSN